MPLVLARPSGIAASDAACQFHSGSIKAIQGIPVVGKLITFQFHSGSIKARGRLDIATCEQERFNSTLVRLRHRDYLNKRDERLRFNSTLVRLRLSR